MTTPTTATRHATPGTGPVRATLRRLRRNAPAMAAVAFLLLVALVGALADILAPFDPFAQLTGPPFAGFSGTHWLGTDDLGRDVFSRLIHGARVSMVVSLLTVSGALVAAVPLGLLAGYAGRRVDYLLMRVMDALMSVPALVLAIVLVAVLGANLTNTMLAIGVFLVPSFARLVRGQALAVKEEAYIEASRSIGSSAGRIVGRHVLPNLLSPLIVQAATTLGLVLIAEASLSFLGLGAQPPQVSWGAMLRQAYEFILVEPTQMLAPGIAIALTVFAFNLVGDGLLEALNAIRPAARTRRAPTLGLTALDRHEPAPVERAEQTENLEQPGQLLSVRDLCVEFDSPAGPAPVVQDVSFTIARGETLGLVGESGSGKTVTSLSMMRLLLTPNARIVGGQVLFEGRDLLDLSRSELNAVRGRDVGVVFQDPMASLTPSLTILNQVSEVVRWHEQVNAAEARDRALEMLELVGISPQRAVSYPHEFSGGMQQRAAMAIALVCRPKLLIADEPTTALDVTVQAQILELLTDLKEQLGLAILFVTHDLGVIADVADRVAVMYAGQVVESGSVRDLFHRTRHPYAAALLRAMPDRTEWGDKLYTLPGQVPHAQELPEGCRLAPRCSYAIDECSSAAVELTPSTSDHLVRCVRAEDLVLERSPR